MPAALGGRVGPVASVRLDVGLGPPAGLAPPHLAPASACSSLPASSGAAASRSPQPCREPSPCAARGLGPGAAAAGRRPAWGPPLAHQGTHSAVSSLCAINIACPLSAARVATNVGARDAPPAPNLRRARLQHSPAARTAGGSCPSAPTSGGSGGAFNASMNGMPRVRLREARNAPPGTLGRPGRFHHVGRVKLFSASRLLRLKGGPCAHCPGPSGPLAPRPHHALPDVPCPSRA